MLKKVNDFLAGILMTAVGGICLVISLILSAAGWEAVIDPAWAAVVICGIPLLYLSVWRIIHNPGISKISSALLITIAMFAAIAIGDLFAAGEVAFIMSVGAILEDKTTERAKKGLRQLISLTPQQGRRIVDGKEEMIPADRIKAGDTLRILPGEAVPADGVILTGETSVDQSVLTGESLPVDKQAGDHVFCGTINRFGTADIRADRVGEDSSLQKLIRMVQEAENKKAPMARIADRCASWLVPVALLIAITAYFGTGNVVRAVTVLVVFCPCALILATPTAIMAAIGQAAKHGVIIKSGEALEKMGRVDTIAFDKTGTLTVGALTVSDVVSFSDKINETELLALAASAEGRSEHPLGKAIVARAKELEIPLAEIDKFHMEGGKGISARVRGNGKGISARMRGNGQEISARVPGDGMQQNGQDRSAAQPVSGREVLCGTEKYLIENGIEIPAAVLDTLEALREQGKASILTACDGVCIGVIALSDVLRPAAGDMVRRLSEMRTQTVLLTGDNEKTAAYFASQAGITSVRARLLPEEKVNAIAELQRAGRSVCMIGDGVNDAPALKAADVGVAMGSMGSDIAVEAADIALMSDDISRIPYLKRLSEATVATIRLSISLSLCINAAAITLSLLGILTPTTGALVHNAGSCLVVLIAALLYDRRFE